MADSSTLPGFDAYDGDYKSVATGIGRLEIAVDVNAGRSNDDVSAGGGERDVEVSQRGHEDDVYLGWEEEEYIPPPPGHHTEFNPAYHTEFTPAYDDSSSDASTVDAANVANAVADALRSVVPAIIAQLTPVMQRAVQSEMRLARVRMTQEKVYSGKKEVGDRVEPLGVKIDKVTRNMDTMITKLDIVTNKMHATDTKVDKMNTEMDTIITRLDNINNKTHATDTNVDGLQQFMANAFGCMDTRMDALGHAVGTSEYAVKQAIKVHGSSTTVASDRSTTVILDKIAESSLGIQEHNAHQARKIQADTEKHFEKLCQSIDKLGVDSIGSSSVLAELSHTGSQISEQIKQQTAHAKDHASAAAVTQEEILKKIRSFQSTVVWLESNVSGHERYLHEWQQNNQRHLQIVEQAGNFVFDKVVKMDSSVAGVLNLFQAAAAPIGADLSRMANACEAMDKRFEGMTTSIQANFRDDYNAMRKDMVNVIDERSRKIMLQESKAYGLHAMYLRPQGARNTKYVLFMIESQIFKTQLPFQTAIPAQRCMKVADILSAAWGKCYLEEVPKNLKKRCVKTKIFLEESVRDQMDEIPLAIGSEYEDVVYGEWYERNVDFGVKNHFKIRVDINRTI